MMYNYKDFDKFEIFMEAEMEHIMLLEKYGKKDEAESEEKKLLEETRKHIDGKIKTQKKESKMKKRIGKALDVFVDVFATR